MIDGKTPPQYHVATVEAVILQVATELHSEQLPTEELLLKIVSDPDDTREIKTGVQALRNLREIGLFTERDDEVVEPTPAALRACALLT